jgi:hypothetical protein
MYESYVISLHEEQQIWVCEKKRKNRINVHKTNAYKDLKPDSIYQNYMFQQKLLERERDYYPLPWREFHS